MRVLFLAAACCLIPMAVAADQPVPVQQEPFHKTVFENDYLRVIDVQISPGSTTLFHVHVVPSVIVYLTKSTNRSETWRTGEILTRETTPGQSRYAAYDEKPLAHRVTNTGASLFRVFDIELLKKAPTSTPLRPLIAPHLKVHWDERLLRSSGIALAGGGSTQIPSTQAAYLVIGTAGIVRIAPSGGPSSFDMVALADYRFFPPHTSLQITNAQDEQAEVVLLELKN